MAYSSVIRSTDEGPYFFNKDPEGSNFMNQKETKIAEFDLGQESPETKMLNILNVEEGISVVGKSKDKVSIPIITPERLIPFIGNKESVLKKASAKLSEIYDFLEGEIYTDGFRDHPQRRLWREQMRIKYGEIFLKVYYRRNQIRRNVLGHVTNAAQQLALFARQNGQIEKSQQMQNLAINLNMALRGGPNQTLMIQRSVDNPEGEDYYTRLPIEGKVEMVRKYEQGALTFLELFAKDSTPRREISLHSPASLFHKCPDERLPMHPRQSVI